MAKYGYCEDCGALMEAAGCPNCQELLVIQSQQDCPEEYQQYKE